MNFNTLEYLLFLPLICLGYWLLPQKVRWIWLLLGSWLFYFWWDPRAGALLIGTTAVTWFCAGQIGKTQARAGKRLWMLIALGTTLAVLAVFKYAGFLASLIGASLTVRIMLPVGISFYTFQTLSYVLDVYRGTISPEPHFGYYALFISFFPQLVAGPIERTEHLLPQLKQPAARDPVKFRHGFWLLLTGFFKKIVIADSLAPYVDQVFGNPSQAAGVDVVLAVFLFGIQIYCDFSGYTDIARGSAALLGVDLMENFNRPYSAVSIRDFWRRWHISLTRWFTDYVYIPLGGNRSGLRRQILSVMIVFLLSGLWHGAGWNFVAWGAIHGLFLCVGLLWTSRHTTAHTTPGRLRRVRTCILVNFAWLFFRAGTLRDAIFMFSRLSVPGFGFQMRDLAQIGLTVLCCVMIDPARDRCSRRTQRTAVLAGFYMLAAIAVVWLRMLSGGDQNAFIYFQF
ncbi:MAG: MBOAT family protein [Oscillospiraceae bacterium]|nr:MBOAT family protein [Oscillospiraceae bacterium]